MLRLAIRPRCSALTSVNAITTLRTISSSAPTLLKQMPPRPPPLPEDTFTEAFLCGTGPGGQKINKTSSAVQLKHLETGLVLKVQATRSRSQNRKIARQMLAERVQDIQCKEKGEKSRIQVVAETKSKRKKSGEKKRKRKYKALEEAKKAEMEAASGAEGIDAELKSS